MMGRREGQILIVLVIGLAFFLLVATPHFNSPLPLTGNPLDGCLHVYLDMGTNRGVQIRKLYEPKYYPDSGVFPVFDKYFGEHSNRNLKEVCAVGFEPNYKWSQLLNETEAALRACGWNVIIHRMTGVGSRDEKTYYARMPGAYPLEMAGRLLDKDKEIKEKLENDVEEKVEVNVIRIARYINEVVATRKLPASAAKIKPSVVMKLDVEGREMEIVPDLVQSGALAHVDNIHVDFSNDPYVDVEAIQKLREAMEFITKVSKEQSLSHTCEVYFLDDESYSADSPPWPKC